MSQLTPYGTRPYHVTHLPNIANAREVRPGEDYSFEKEQYVRELVLYPGDSLLNRDFSYSELEHRLYRLPLETLKLLHKHLCRIFTIEFPNYIREGLISILLDCVIDEHHWPEIFKQTFFIVPKDSSGHDIVWAARIIFSNFYYWNRLQSRDLIVNTANRLFKWDYDSGLRVRILASLAELPIDEVEEIHHNEERAALFLNNLNAYENSLNTRALNGEINRETLGGKW